MGDQNFCTRGARRIQPSGGGSLHRLEGGWAALETLGHRARRRQRICFILVARSQEAQRWGRSAFRSKQTKRSRSKYDRVRRRAGSPAYAERPCLSQFVSFSLGPALLPALSHFPSVFAGFLLAFSSSYPLAGNAGLPFPRHPVGLPATTRQPRDSASRHRHPSRFKGQGRTPPSQHGFRWSWRHVLRRRSPLVLSQQDLQQGRHTVSVLRHYVRDHPPRSG